MGFLCAMRAVVIGGLLPSETLPRAQPSYDTRHERLPSPCQRPLRTLPPHCRARLRRARRRLTLRVPEQRWHHAEAVPSSPGDRWSSGPPLPPYGLGQRARRRSRADAFGLRALMRDRLRGGMAPGLPAGLGIWVMPVVTIRGLGETGCVEQHVLHLVHIRAREFDPRR